MTASHARGVELPTPHSSLVDRKDELATITTLLSQSQVRLVTLTGPGGSGKTRLAITAAAHAAPAFPVGVVFVDLAPIVDPGLVAATIAQSLGLRDMGMEPMAERLFRALGDARLLLVLDNFEQVVSAAPLLSELLGNCPGITFLVTSRIRLRLSAEREIALGPLALPPVRDENSEAGEPEAAAVQLFIERARAVQPDLAIDTANLADIAEIVHRLDGLPLAIELAAVRLRALSPASLLERLEPRLPLLTGGARDLPARQRTMRDTISWSYELLTPYEQALFRRLAVFAGGFTLEAAEFVSGASGSDAPLLVLDGITALIDHSLLGLVSESRYQLLEIVREFAWDQLQASGELAEVQQRHATWFLSLVEAAESHFSGPDQAAWLDHLESEYANLRLALAWCMAHDPDKALLLGAGLRFFWRIRGHLGEGAAELERALATGAGTPQARARALVALASIRNLQADYERAATLAEEARALSEHLGDRHGVAEALRRIAPFHLAAAHATSPHDETRFEMARSLWAEELALRQELHDADGIAWATMNLAVTAMARGDIARAFQLFEEALPLLTAVGDTYGVTNALSNLGWTAAETENEALAAGFFVQALEKSRELGDHWSMATLLEKVSGLLVRLEQAERAARILAAAAAYREADHIGTSSVRHIGYAEAVASARTKLGEERFSAATAAGRELTLEEAVTAALAAFGPDVTIPGGSDQGPAHARDVTQHRPSPLLGDLTPREEQVLRLLAEGLTNAQIAERLSLSPKTVSSHLVSIFGKLGVSSRVSAVRMAIDLGLV